MVHGPNIVTDSLVLMLDVGNVQSYPGSGSTWYDLAKGKTFSAQGTQTPFETVGGAKSFGFNGSGYWLGSGTSGTNVDMGGEMSLILWLYGENITTRQTVFEKIGASGLQSYQTEIAMTWEVTENFTWYSRYNSYGYGSSAETGGYITLNAWNMFSIRQSTAKTSAARTAHWSMNGSAYTSNYTERSSTPVLEAGEIKIGTGYAGTVANGQIAIVMAYERQLTDAEILQNYNAHKSRFGL